jgi:rfaE bifunctional protein kinase chain/domain/rfaE bifunctional protein nucleotidyltransferase chain/domain
MKKILDKKTLLEIIAELRKNKKKIVLCHGVFDLVHYGHILHFQSAKKIGDVLIVSITKDKFIKKGIGRPVFNETQRLDYLNEIKIIDYIYLCESESAEHSIKLIKPDFYVKGPDYKNNLQDRTKKILLEKKLVKKFGGNTIYTADKKFSSSTIINEYNLINHTPGQNKFIQYIKKKYSYDYIREEILAFKKINVMVVGELIFDNYIFGDIIGKSGKEPHLVFQEVNNEFYVGGAGAVSRHLSSFVNRVDLVANFGGEFDLKKVLKNSFDKNIYPYFLRNEENENSIIKKRFVDRNSNYKMFGSYILPGKANPNFFKKLISKIKKRINYNDILIVCDYGHNLIDTVSAKFISDLKKFTTLNAQLNSSNIGYHGLNKYNYADVVVINESELRQELRDNRSDLNILSQFLINKNKIKNLVVTQGKQGSTLFRKNFKPISCPAFSNYAVDKVGAGDAMLSIISLAMSKKLDLDISLFLGSIAASINVKTLGNKTSVDFNEMDRIIQNLLK